MKQREQAVYILKVQFVVSWTESESLSVSVLGGDTNPRRSLFCLAAATASRLFGSRPFGKGAARARVHTLLRVDSIVQDGDTSR